MTSSRSFSSWVSSPFFMWTIASASLTAIVSLGVLKSKRRVCIRNASRKVRQLETRTLSSQPRKRSNSLHPPGGWRAAGELGRAGRAVSAGPAVVSAPRESLARPGGGAAGGGSESLPLEQPGKEKPNGENQRGKLNACYTSPTAILSGARI